MKLRIAFSAAACVLGAFTGCGEAVKEPEPRPEEPVVESRGAIEVYRAETDFDAGERRFQFWIGPPVLVTSIHNQYVEEFIRRPGFGFLRGGMPPSAPSRWVELCLESEGDRHRRAEQPAKADSQPKYDGVKEMLTLRDGTELSVRERVWTIADQQLVSVHGDNPAVFLQSTKEQHEMMKERKPETERPPTRPLDEFETEALPHLREGGEVALQAAAAEMRVFGAVRARAECIACHKVEVGTLLGAFTYTLKAQSEATPAEECLQNTAGLSSADLRAVQAVEALGGKVIRADGGPITEIDFSANTLRDFKTQFGANRTKHLPIRNSALRILEGFPGLQVLNLSSSHVSDDGVSALVKLKNLTKLNLCETNVTDAGVAAIRKELPGCVVARTTVKIPMAP